MARSTGKMVGMASRILLLGAVAMPALLTSAPASPAHSQEASRRINGYEVSGRFLEEWSKYGSEQASVYVNGLPITPRRPEISTEDGKTYEMQWFERARYELHPTNRKPNDVLLGRLGAFIAEGRGRIDPTTLKVAHPADQPFVGIDRPPDADGKQKVWFQETRHTLSGKFLEYWNRYGGLAQFGYPLSEPFQEISLADGKSYLVQYFERNRFELHPEKPAPYEVELGLLGVEQHRMQPVPGDQLPVAPQNDVTTTRDTIVIAMTQEPRNLTFADNSSAGRRLRSLFEDHTTGRDDNDNLFPLNAWYVPTFENGGARFLGTGEDRYLQVKYKLRQGIKWSDGKEMTSIDAILAYRLLIDPVTPFERRSEYLRLQNVDNPNKYTVVYNYRSLKQAREFFESVPDKENYHFIRVFVEARKPVASKNYSEVGAIYPEHVLGRIAPSQIPDDPVSLSPIGTGPWKVRSWTRRQEVVVVPNEHYSLTAKPAIKTMRIKFVPYLSLAQVRTGEINMITSETFNTPPPDRAGLQAAGFRIASRPAHIWEHITFSFWYEPFKDRAVREAIFTAINRQRIANDLYQNMSGVMNSVVPPSFHHSLEHPDFARRYPDIAARFKLPIYRYDPTRANQILDQAGWARGSDGIRAKGGQRLSFEYGTTTQAARQQIQALVQADLRAIGVEAVPQSYSASVFLAQDASSPLWNGQTKLAQFSWTGLPNDDFSEWTCDGLKEPGFTSWPRNWHGYCNGRVDTLNKEYQTANYPNDWVAASAEAQVTLMSDMVTLPLVQRPNVELVTEKLANHKLPNSQLSSFWNARQWYFR